MTLKSDAKFRENLTCGFKYNMRNLLSFHTTTQKSKNFTSIGYFCPKYMRFKLKRIQRSYLSWHWTVMQNLNKPWPCGFKNSMRNWVNFHYSTQKSEKFYTDKLFLSKAYDVLTGKCQSNYMPLISQNLKENWLMAWKMTQGIWLIFMRAVESLKICTLIGSFCPNHAEI